MRAVTQWLERFGNQLPNPVLLFLYLWLAVIAAAHCIAWFDVGVRHPATQEWVYVRSLLSVDGLSWWLNNAISAFTGFAPVGPVLIVMLGIGIAERSGYLRALLLSLLPQHASPILTFMIVFVGILSSLAFDAGYVVVLPLSAYMFHLLGRSPLLGIAAAFAAVSGGYSANLMIGPVDFILAGISTEAAQLIEPERQIAASANWYFMIASVLLLSCVITVVVERYLEPLFKSAAISEANLETRPETASVGIDPSRPLDKPNDNDQLDSAMIDQQRPDQQVLDQQGPDNVAFFWSSLSLLIMAASVAVLISGWLPLTTSSGDLLSAVLLRNLSIVIGCGFMLSGTLYGYLTQRYQTDVWVTDLEETWRQLVPYLILMFFAAQFVSSFAWTQLGLTLAVNGAELLTQAAVDTPILMLGLILMTALINLLVGSASAKWALLAPVLIPMLMLVGVDPEVTQLAYRIGDSSTNIITPLMPYFPLILILMQRYQPNAGIGTLLALMLPLSLAMLLTWSGLLFIWLLIGWPLGPVSG